MTGPARILVAGAGPAGLALALQAHDHGADVRVIDEIDPSTLNEQFAGQLGTIMAGFVPNWRRSQI